MNQDHIADANATPDEATPNAAAQAAAATEASGDTTEASAELTPEEEAEEALAAIEQLGPLFDRAVRSIKPLRLAAECQRVDRATFFRYFKGQRAEKFTRPFMIKVLRKEIFERRNIIMAHLFMVLWNDAQRDLYSAMRKHVATIDEDVEKVERIEDDRAREFMADLADKGFALEDIYICVRLNDVRFSPEFIDEHVTPEVIRGRDTAAAAG